MEVVKDEVTKCFLCFTVKEAGRDLTGFWYCFVSGDKDVTLGAEPAKT